MFDVQQQKSPSPVLALASSSTSMDSDLIFSMSPDTPSPLHHHQPLPFRLSSQNRLLKRTSASSTIPMYYNGPGTLTRTRQRRVQDSHPDGSPLPALPKRLPSSSSCAAAAIEASQKKNGGVKKNARGASGNGCDFMYSLPRSFTPHPLLKRAVPSPATIRPSVSTQTTQAHTPQKTMRQKEITPTSTRVSRSSTTPRPRTHSNVDVTSTTTISTTTNTRMYRQAYPSPPTSPSPSPSYVSSLPSFFTLIAIRWLFRFIVFLLFMPFFPPFFLFAFLNFFSLFYFYLFFGYFFLFSWNFLMIRRATEFVPRGGPTLPNNHKSSKCAIKEEIIPRGAFVPPTPSGGSFAPFALEFVYEKSCRTLLLHEHPSPFFPVFLSSLTFFFFYAFPGGFCHVHCFSRSLLFDVSSLIYHSI